MEWDTLPHIILIPETYWDTSIIDSTEAEDDAWFNTVFYSSKLEYHGTFYMHGDYVDQTIVQDTELIYFNANIYDEDYDFIIDSCVSHAANLQSHENNIFPSKLVQISERDV